MSCEHDYDATSGPPTGNNETMLPVRPCGSCWQSRAAYFQSVLEKIAEGRGTFSLDHFRHCKNTVQEMKTLAERALWEKP